MFSFFVPGEPKGKARPRVTVHGTYTPKSSKEYESRVKAAFVKKYPAYKAIEKGIPVNVYIIAYFKIPKSISKVKRALIAEGNVFPTIKPDCDNIGKAIMDALNGLAYYDDNQVVDCRIQKRYALCDNGVGVKVFITDYLEYPELFKADEVTGFEV